MSLKRKTGMLWMVMITVIIITGSIVLVRFSGEALEKQLLSQSLPFPETIKIEGGYLEFEYPWETSGENLRKADEEEKNLFQESGYVEQLERLALLLRDSAVLNTDNLLVDEEGRLVHRGRSKNELSYVVDLESGIVGFGLEPEKETDDTAKEKNVNELIVLLDDPMQEIYQFLPAVNGIWNNEGIPVLEGLQANQERSLSSIYDYINGFPRQVLYYRDVLTVILETEENDMILQFDPATQKYMSIFLLTK